MSKKNKFLVINGTKFPKNIWGDNIRIPLNNKATLYAAMSPQSIRVGDFIFCTTTQANAEASITRLKDCIEDDIEEKYLDEGYGCEARCDRDCTCPLVVPEDERINIEDYPIYEIRRLSKKEIFELLRKEKLNNSREK